MQKQKGLLADLNPMNLHVWSEVSLDMARGCLLCIVSPKGIDLGHNNKIKLTHSLSFGGNCSLSE